MIIYNASSVPLGTQNTNLPNVSTTLETWFQDISMEVLTKGVVDNRLVETATTVSFRGDLQPFKSQLLELKPEGERSWKWYTLRCWPNVYLKMDDIAVIRNERYRVMGRIDYHEYGYVEYEMIKDYQE